MKVDKIAIPFFQVTVLRKSHRGGFSGVCDKHLCLIQKEKKSQFYQPYPYRS